MQRLRKLAVVVSLAVGLGVGGLTAPAQAANMECFAGEAGGFSCISGNKLITCDSTGCAEDILPI